MHNYEFNCCDDPTYFSDEELERHNFYLDSNNIIAYAKAQGWIP